MIRKLTLVLLVAIPAALSAAGICDTPGNLVKNCGFEDTLSPSWTTGNFSSYSGQWWGVYHSGEYSLSLSNYSLRDGVPNTGPATAEQTIIDVPGDTYEFSFWIHSIGTNSGQPGNQAGFTVDWNAQNLLTLVNESNMEWTQYVYTVIGNGSDTITFGGFNDAGYNYLDDIVLRTSIPEPGTCGLLLACLPLLVAAMRRRSK